jgi:hypothetical protein
VEEYITGEIITMKLLNNKKGSGNGFLLVYLIPIIIFWIALPSAFMLFNIGGLTNNLQNDINVLQSVDNPNILNYLTIAISGLAIFFKMVFIWVDGLPIAFNLLLWVIRAVSWFIIIIAIRG